VIEEPESVALHRHLAKSQAVLATSRIATVEIPRATRLANPSDRVRQEVDRLLGACMLIAVTAQLLRSARRLASQHVRTLDAIHVASAIRVEADEFLAYDWRLLAAAAAEGLAVASPH
jgi:hypothetical protein